MKILEVRTIPLALVRKRLMECQEKGFVVRSIARRTMELADMLSKCGQPEELYEKLLGLGLKDLTASMIVDIAPKTEEEVKILLGFEESMSDETVSKVLELVSTYCYKNP
jgi:DNA-directed RNA polymerase subunit F